MIKNKHAYKLTQISNVQTLELSHSQKNTKMNIPPVNILMLGLLFNRLEVNLLKKSTVISL